MDKLDGLYPMPGGVTRYFETALEILGRIGPEGRAVSDVRAWLLERFKVDGAVAVPGYLKLLAALGWVAELDDRLGLTPRGAALFETRDTTTAFADLDARFTGISETLGLLRAGSRPRREMLAELNHVREIEPSMQDGEHVTLGSKVTLKAEDGRRVTYTLLGPIEADNEKGVLSYLSPIGAALLGRKVGQDAEVILASGTVKYRVEALENGLKAATVNS